MVTERGSESDVVLADEIPGDEPIYPGMTYEINHVIEFNQEVDEYQANVLIEGFFRRWTNQHPNLKVEYQAVRSSSEAEARTAGLDPQKSYTTTTQIKRPSTTEAASISLTAAAVAAAVSAVLAFIAANAVNIVITAAVIAGLWLIYETGTYIKSTITGEETYVCRKHEEPIEFDSYERFRQHYQSAHPNEEVPPEKTGIGDIVLYSAVAIGGAMVLSSVFGGE